MPTVVLTQRTHQVTQVNQQRQPGEAMGHPIHAREWQALLFNKLLALLYHHRLSTTGGCVRRHGVQLVGWSITHLCRQLPRPAWVVWKTLCYGKTCVARICPILPLPYTDAQLLLERMSLTWSLSRPFTISTYGPPSTSVLSGQASAGGPGRRLGGGSEPHQDPDNHDKISQNSVTRTPSARAKGQSALRFGAGSCAC